MDHRTFANEMKNYTILYVEDDNSLREQITEFLSRYCQTVYACPSSEEGLKLYQKYHPDILLLDVNLPGISGLDFATHVREHDIKTRILILTAYTNTELMQRAIELDLTRYLVKPATSEDLFAAFGKCLEELNVDEITDLCDGYSYNKKHMSVINNNDVVALRKKEAEILEFFIAHKGEVVRYDMLENSVWSEGVMSQDAIRSQIRNIRKKIGNGCLENIFGVGYRLKVNNDT